MDDKQTFREDLGRFAMPLLESDISYVDKEGRCDTREIPMDSIMASPPRESRELNEYLLRWSNETKLLTPVETPICKSVSESTAAVSTDASYMSYRETDDSILKHGQGERENIMAQHDYARKRRRSYSSPSSFELQPDDLTPLIMQELSMSSNRLQNPQTMGMSTADDLTASGEREDDVKGSYSEDDDELVPVQNVEYLDEYVIDDKNTWCYSNFLKAHSCYDIIPHSSKIVVFDTRLRVKKAFFALVYNGIRSAPLWDAVKHEFVGMLTISDFINILRCYYKSPLIGMSELEEHKIETWREISKADLNPKLISISPTASLHEAVRMLVENKIHRLPVIEPGRGNALFILTHKKILNYLYTHFEDMAMPDFMGYTLSQLGIGTHDNIATVRPDTTVIKAFNIFAERRVSALPVVNENDQVVDIYARFDVINLAAEKTYNDLDVTVSEALLHRQLGFEGGVHRCQITDTFYAVIDKIVSTKVHRLVVVDDDDHVLGIISLSDILKFLILNPVTKEPQNIIGTPIADMEI